MLSPSLAPSNFSWGPYFHFAEEQPKVLKLKLTHPRADAASRKAEPVFKSRELDFGPMFSSITWLCLILLPFSTLCHWAMYFFVLQNSIGFLQLIFLYRQNRSLCLLMETFSWKETKNVLHIGGLFMMNHFCSLWYSGGRFWDRRRETPIIH